MKISFIFQVNMFKCNYRIIDVVIVKISAVIQSKAFVVYMWVAHVDLRYRFRPKKCTICTVDNRQISYVIVRQFLGLSVNV